MHALHVPHAYRPAIGGAELLVRRVGLGLATRGHVVTVIAPDYSSAEGFFRPGVTRTQLPDMYDEGVRVLWARMVNRQTLGDHTKRNSTRFSRQLASLSRGLDFEIVMSLPHLMPNVVAASNLAVKRNKPLVLAPLLHEDDPNWPTRQLQVHLSKASAVMAYPVKGSSSPESASTSHHSPGGTMLARSWLYLDDLPGRRESDRRSRQ
jgi:hypothetical protein